MPRLAAHRISDMQRKLSFAEEWLYLWCENGEDPGNNEWHAFDPSLSKWFKLPPMPHDGRIAGHSSYASLDGKVFVIGGSVLESDDESYIPSKFILYFDTSTHCWGRIADLNVARIRCMPGVINGKLYVFGGYLEGHEDAPIDTVEVYDSSTGTWSFVFKMPFPMEIYDSVVVGGKFYVKRRGRRRMGFVYDVDKDVWEGMAYGMQTGWECRSAVVNGKLYTLDDRFSRVIKDEIHVYNEVEDTWEEVEGYWDVGALPGMLEEVQVVSLGGNLFIVGVQMDGPEHYNAIFLAILEMKESVENQTSFKTFGDEITKKIHFGGAD